MDTPGHPPGIAIGSQFVGRGALSHACVHLPRLHRIGMQQLQDSQHAQHSTALPRESCVYAVATSVVVSRGSFQRDADGRSMIQHRVASGDEPSQVQLCHAFTWCHLRGGIGGPDGSVSEQSGRWRCVVPGPWHKHRSALRTQAPFWEACSVLQPAKLQRLLQSASQSAYSTTSLSLADAVV